MRKVELLEASGILVRMMTGLLGTVPGPTVGRQNAAVRRACADITAKSQLLIATAALATPLINAFLLATKAGASYASYDRLRIQLIGETPKALAAIAVTQLGVRYTLSQQSVIVALTNFDSRQDADDLLKRVNGAFDPAEEDAADSYDAGTYQALIALHGAVTRDLVDRSMLLPRVVRYDTRMPLPSLAVAQKLYPDDMRVTDRSNELWKENKVIHPAFMPPHGICLSDVNAASQ